MQLSARPIGVYDSGIGGLTVLKELLGCFPQENFIYLADSIHLPYGEKSKAQVLQYSQNMVTWFEKKMRAKVVVAACHTSSVLALPELVLTGDMPVMGMVIPLLNYLKHHPKHRKIGVLATPAAVESQRYERLFRQRGITEVLSVGCPLFVPLIEAGDLGSRQMLACAKAYLKPLLDFKLDTLVYGCTHYPLIHGLIKRLLPSQVDIIDPAKCVALELGAALNLPESSSDQVGKVEFYCSGDREVFQKKVQVLMGLAGVSVLPFSHGSERE